MPFDALAETLLKGGIAPRHVRRYIRELDEHLEDLTAQQCAAGYDREEAYAFARARLGDDSELAQAMLDQPAMRSWPARMPWLVFLLLPPVLTAAIGLALYAAVCAIGYAAAMTAVQMLAAPIM
ncbi:MAG TPA: permease prefix domain 1-containing protein, partial [Rhizomicrobium sp.]|nr:permease prefix domain 1-containing protein [Rhizomicrobium sp.]